MAWMRALRSASRRIGHRRARPQQQGDDGDQPAGEDQAEGNDEGFQHALLLA